MNRRINKNFPAMEKKFDEKYTYQNIEEVRIKAEMQLKAIAAKEQQLKEELEELSKLYAEYDNLQCEAEMQGKNLKAELDLIGGNLKGNVIETRKAVETYEELECYVGNVGKVMHDGILLYEIPKIPKFDAVYRIMENGEKRVLTVLETNQYARDFC